MSATLQSKPCPALRWLRMGILVLLAIALGAAEPSRPEKTAAPAPPVATQLASTRLREGTEIIDQVGTFQVAGERLIFIGEKGAPRMVALENLNLERVARAIANHPHPLLWKVSGTATEFRGGNFLIIERAILKGSAQP